MADVATRVVSLVPSWTETVFALGRGPALVGCTRYCVEPEAELALVPRVGGTKNPDLDAVFALDPDLVLVDTEENRAEDIARLRERVPVYEAMPRTVAEATQVVRELGDRLDAVDDASTLLLEVEAQLTRAEVQSLTRGGRVPRVFYAIWPKPWMSINGDTYIHDVLSRAGAMNVTGAQVDRYPSYEVEDLADFAPDLVLLPDEPFVFGPEHRDEALAEGWFGDAAVELVDGKDFCWHGARTGPGLGRVLDLLEAWTARVD